MKLEISKLAPYLSHGLKYFTVNNSTNKNNHNHVDILVGITKDIRHENSYVFWGELQSGMTSFYYSIKPILRPMNEVEDYFLGIYGSLEHEDVTEYLDVDFLEEHDNLVIDEIQYAKIENLPYGTLRVLLKHHFDVFGLIEKGLAIDVNALD